MIRICLYTATWCPFSQTFLESDKGKSFLREIDDAHTSGICRFSHFKNELAFAKLRYLSKQDVQFGGGVPTLVIQREDKCLLFHPNSNDYLDILSLWMVQRWRCIFLHEDTLAHLFPSCLSNVIIDYVAFRQ